MNKYISLILFSIFFVACGNESDLDMNILPEGKYPIEFSTDNFIMPTTKSFTNGGIAGVYMTVDDNSFTDNDAPYIYANSSRTLSAYLNADKHYWTRPEQEITVSAYYPRNASINDISEQSSLAKYNSFDVLYARGTIGFSERTKALTFNHLMSRIVIKLTGTYVSDVTIVKIANTFTQATFAVDINNGAVTGGATIKHITPYKSAVDTYEAVVIPGQTITNGTNLIYVATNQNQKTYQCTLTQDITFNAGQQYTFTIEMN